MWWLLAKHGDHGTDLLALDRDGERTLPVFSGEDEAEMFVCLRGAFECGWQVRETSGGELISILCGPCGDVRSVALDPSPVMESGMLGLISMNRERFLDWILTLGRSLPAARAAGSGLSFSEAR